MINDQKSEFRDQNPVIRIPWQTRWRREALAEGGQVAGAM
jgi:hypothetical protein